MTRAAVFSPALSREIRALLPFWGATIAGLAAASVWRWSVLPDAGLMAYVAGSMAIGAHSIGQEYTYHTLPTLLSQPVDRRRVYLRKFVVAAAMLLSVAALAWLVVADGALQPTSLQLSFVMFPLLCGLFLAPLFTMICRGSLAGMILCGIVPALAWFATLAIAWFWFGIGIEAAERIFLGYFAGGMMVACPVIGLLGWRKFSQLEAIEGSSSAFHLPRWLARAEGVRKRHPILSLASKELHLQQLTFAVIAFQIVFTATLVLLHRLIPSWETFPIGAVTLLYCVILSILIGALASAEERQHGTLDWQLLQPTPAWQQWMVKVGVAFGLALLFGVGFPILIAQFPIQGIRVAWANLAAVVVLLTGSSIYISSLSSSGVRAMMLALPVGMAAVLFVQMVAVALRWVTAKLVGPLIADIVTGAIVPPSFGPEYFLTLIARVLALTLVALLLWFGFLNHRSSERSARGIFKQVAWIAVFITTGMMLVAGIVLVYELPFFQRSR